MITQEYLKSIAYYDPETGLFKWIVKRKRFEIGQFFGVKEIKGYLSIRIDGKRYRLHNLAWLYMTGSFPVNIIDHKDTNKENNKWSNLREATHSQNNFNRNKFKNNTSGAKGVTYREKYEYYEAKIKVNGKYIHLGTFKMLEEASKAYQDAAIKYAGEFARN